MIRNVLVSVSMLIAMMITPLVAFSASGTGPVKISYMARVESHTKIADVNGNFGGESYAYNMISVVRKLDENVIGNIYYLNQYSLDKSRFSTHIGGASLINVFSSKWIGTLGYSYSSNPEEIRTLIPFENQDKFSMYLLYNINPKAPKYKFTLLSGYTAVTALNRQRGLSERLDVTFPVFSEKYTGNVGYTYTYVFDKNTNGDRFGHLANQYSANLSYALCKNSKLVLGYIFIDKQFDSPDDQVAQLSLLSNLR